MADNLGLVTKFHAPSQELEHEGKPRPAERFKYGSDGRAEEAISKARASELPLDPTADEPYIEPWTGWRLIAAWTALALASWLIVYGVGLAVYEIVLWIAP